MELWSLVRKHSPASINFHGVCVKQVMCEDKVVQYFTGQDKLFEVLTSINSRINEPVPDMFVILFECFFHDDFK